MKVAELIAELGLEVNKESFEVGNKLLEGVKHGLEALAVFEAIDKLKEWTEHVAETADAATKMGERMGISAEAVQELSYAASSSDTSMGQLSAGLMKMERRLDDAAKKGGKTSEALAKLHITGSELAKLPLDEKLERIADGFKALPDNTNKQDLASKLGLGSSAIVLLDQGGEGIRKLRDEARELGLVVEEETAKSFAEWNDSMARIRGAIQGLKNDAVVALLPSLKQLTDQLFEWIKANRELLKQRLEQVLKLLVSAMQGLAKAFAVVYSWFEKAVPVIENVAGALANLLGLSESAGSEFEAIALAVGGAWALANLPLLLMMGLIAAAILIVDDLWSGLQGGDSVTKELLDAFTEYLGESGAGRVVLGLRASVEALIESLVKAIGWLKELGEYVGGSVYKHLNFTTEGAAKAEQLPKGTAGDTTRAIFGAFGGFGAIDSIKQETPGVDKVVRAGDAEKQARADAFAQQYNDAVTRLAANQAGPVTAVAATVAPPAVNVAAPQLSVAVTVQSGAGDQSTAQLIVEHIEKFFDAAIQDAQIVTGAKGGKIP